MGPVISVVSAPYFYFFPKKTELLLFIKNETGFNLRYITHEGSMPERSKTMKSNIKNSYGGKVSGEISYKAMPSGEASRNHESTKEVNSEDGLNNEFCNTLDNGKWTKCNIKGPYLSFEYTHSDGNPRRNLGLLFESHCIAYIKSAETVVFSKRLEPHEYPNVAELNTTTAESDGHQTTDRNQAVVSPSSASISADDDSNQSETGQVAFMKAIEDYGRSELERGIDTTGLWSKLMDKKILTHQQARRCSNEKGNLSEHDQVSLLLDMLCSCGDDKIAPFCEVLRKQNQVHIAKHFEKYIPK